MDSSKVKKIDFYSKILEKEMSMQVYIETIKKRNVLRQVIEPVNVDSNFFEGFDYTVINETQLLFQTGYLTVKDRKLINLIPQYTLDIPNNEIRKALFDYLLTAYSNYPLEQTHELRRRMQEQLLQGDTAALEQSLRECWLMFRLPCISNMKHIIIR
jgi:hypothetical protein